MAVSIKFERCGVRDGEILYRLIIGGRTVREDLSIDQVVEVINARDEESLGAAHGVGTVENGTTPHPLRGSSPGQGSQRAAEGVGPYGENGGCRDGHDHV